MYELHNAGDTPVDYDIDTQPLTALREDNYLMSILECLHPKGRVPPGGCVAVGFVFSPPEAKRYAVSQDFFFLYSHISVYYPAARAAKYI